VFNILAIVMHFSIIVSHLPVSKSFSYSIFEQLAPCFIISRFLRRGSHHPSPGSLGWIIPLAVTAAVVVSVVVSAVVSAVVSVEVSVVVSVSAVSVIVVLSAAVVVLASVSLGILGLNILSSSIQPFRSLSLFQNASATVISSLITLLTQSSTYSSEDWGVLLTKWRGGWDGGGI